MIDLKLKKITTFCFFPILSINMFHLHLSTAIIVFGVQFHIVVLLFVAFVHSFIYLFLTIIRL